MRTNEADEKNHSSLASFIPLASKFSRFRADACRSSEDAESVHSQSELSSTDPGNDICPTFVDFDDFTDFTSSDNEDTCSEKAASTPRSMEGAGATCIYSIMMLLRMRAAVCDEEDDCEVRYGTRLMSELPTPSTPKAKSLAKTRAPAASTNSAESWRSPSAAADSWRQALPESAADSWVAQQRQRFDTHDDDNTFLRAARCILNKLTIEKFESLFEQLVLCGIKRAHHVSILMREVFEKATTQHHFIPMYADLCVKLEKDPRVAAVVEEADLPNNFRRLLLNQCQHIFEQLLESRSDEASADEEVVFRRKQEALGNMKLIGQLLVNGMLSSDLFPGCCEELLRKRMECPEALESLVALMMVAGPKFDYRDWQYYHRLQIILADMRILTKEKSVPPRLRFLIRDVLDARDAGWPSSLGGGKTPTTLEEARNAAVLPVNQKDQAPQTPAVEKGQRSPNSHAKTQGRSREATKSVKPWRKNSATCGQKDSTQTTTPAAPVVEAPSPPKAFDVVTFRRVLGTIFSDLASDKNIPAAVQKVRLQQVPAHAQADQFMDILTRIVEERRGAVRRCELAFIAGLAAAEHSAFDRKEVLVGIGRFFTDVYPDLCNEVHRLPAIMKSEFIPTVLNVLPAEELNKVVPTSMRR